MTTIDFEEKACELLESLHPLNFGKRFMFQKYCKSLISQNKIEEEEGLEDYLTDEFLYDNYFINFKKFEAKNGDLVESSKKNNQIYERLLNQFQNNILLHEEQKRRESDASHKLKKNVAEMGLKAILMTVACMSINDIFLHFSKKNI